MAPLVLTHTHVKPLVCGCRRQDGPRGGRGSADGRPGGALGEPLLCLSLSLSIPSLPASLCLPRLSLFILHENISNSELTGGGGRGSAYLIRTTRSNKVLRDPNMNGCSDEF